jgi:hypothetical protein
MNNISYRTRNKVGWPDGPWMTEDDKRQFTDLATGLPCLIVRGPYGALCGYVGVNKNHPYFGQSYSDIHAEVHGGLTFAGKCRPGDEAETICHLVSEGEDDEVWWLGFDCSHAFDFMPKMGIIFGHDDKCVYRDMDYVTKEIENLAIQLKQAEAIDIDHEVVKPLELDAHQV